jgi:hypothetical protein
MRLTALKTCELRGVATPHRTTGAEKRETRRVCVLENSRDCRPPMQR